VQKMASEAVIAY